jgi:DNA-directed RNA polymerase specialized sigma subunit
METDTEPDLDAEWQSWKKSQDPQRLRQLVTKLQPTIGKTLAASGIRSPVVIDRAKLVAAKALHSFDPTKGAKIKTYVASQLRSIVRDAPQIQEPLVPGQRYRSEMAELHKAHAQFADAFGRDPTDEELSETTNIPLRKVVRLRSASRARIPMSMVEEADDDEDAPDVIGSTRTKYDDWADAVYYGLGDIDRLIMSHKTGYRNYEVLDNQQIAQRLNLTPDTVQRRAQRIQQQLDAFQERRV